MQAFIKDNRMIINSMILDDEKEKLLDFINSLENKQIKSIPLYNIEGDISGIAFEALEENQEESQEENSLEEGV